MNYRMIFYVLGRMAGAQAVLMMIPAFVSLMYADESTTSFLLASMLLLVFFLLFGRKKPGNMRIYIKEGFVITALVWILWSLFGAIPYFATGYLPAFEDAFFEAMSGFTTTGATTLLDIEILPKGLLFWRSFSQWIGGMGVLVFVLAFIPLTDKRSMYLMQAEVPGHTVDKLVPKVKTTAKLLYGIYMILSLLQIFLLVLGKMPLYDALVNTFAAAGTGGASIYNASIGAYNSTYAEFVIALFMILFGINFNLFYFLMLRRFMKVIKNEELLVYLGLILSATLFVAWNIYPIYQSAGQSLRYSGFQVVSMITTSGFVSADYAAWPLASQYVLMALMVIGACSASTGGGLKVSRILILLKTIGREIKQVLNPRSVNIVRLNGRRVEKEVLDSVYVYFIAHIAVFAGSLLIIAMEQVDFQTAFSAVLSSLNNTGVGIGQVGPSHNFSSFHLLSKLTLCFDMLAGRLEIFPILVMFSPHLWRQKF